MLEHDETLVVLTTGKTDRGMRATLAFCWACSALAMGQRTSIFLTMDGTCWASSNSMKGVRVGGFEPLDAYLESFLSLGGRLLVCAPCTEFYCDRSAKDSDRADLIDGAEPVGLATVVSLAGPGCRVITL